MRRVAPLLAGVGLLTLLLGCTPPVPPPSPASPTSTTPSTPAPTGASAPAPTSASAATPAATPASGYLHTDGTLIVDATGRPAPLRGVNDSLATKKKTHEPDEAEMAQLASWGFTALRLVVFWHELEPTPPVNGEHQWNDAYLARLDEVLRLAHQHGLRVILDMHQASWSPLFGGVGLPSWLYPGTPGCARDEKCAAKGEATCAFLRNTASPGVSQAPWDGLVAAWQLVARRYAQHPAVVGVDLFNEPQACGDGDGGTYQPDAGATPLDDLYELLGGTVHAIQPQWLLIYEDNAYAGYSARGFALTRRLDLPNAVYSSHFYGDSWTGPTKEGSCRRPGGPSGQRFLSEHLARSDGWNQPFFLGEFDGFHQTTQEHCPYDTDVAGASADTRAMLAFLKQRHVSWTLWSYANGTTMLNPDGSPKQPLLDDLRTGL